MDRWKVISLALAILLFLTALSVALTIFLRRYAAPGTAPSPEAFNGFLFLRDNQIMLFSKDGQISSSSARENITNFAYSQKDKTIYFLRDGDIWQQPLDSTVSAALTRIGGRTTALFLSPSADEIAYITRDMTSTATSTALPPPNLTLINTKSKAKIATTSIPGYNIDAVAWEANGQLAVRQTQINPTNRLLSQIFFYDRGLAPLPLPESPQKIISQAWSPSQTLKATASSADPPNATTGQDITITVSDQKGQLLGQTRTRGFFREFAWSSDGKYLAAGLANTLTWVQTDRLSNWQTAAFDNPITSVRFLSDDRMILTVSAKTTKDLLGHVYLQGSIYLVDPATGKDERIVNNGSNPWPL